MNKKSVKTGYQWADVLKVKTKTQTVLFGQDMEGLYKNQIGWHTEYTLHMHQDNNSHTCYHQSSWVVNFYWLCSMK